MLEMDTDGPVFLQRTHPDTLTSDVPSSDMHLPSTKGPSSASTESATVTNECKDHAESEMPIRRRNIINGNDRLSFSKEESKLMQFYIEIISGKTEKSNLIVIDGQVGCGKSQLAETLRHSVEIEGSGYFIVGKFDPLQPDPPKPYAGFVTAIEAFTTAVITRGETDAILSDCMSLSDEDIGILTGMVPSLERLFGRRNSHETKGSARPGCHDRIGRFVQIFLAFLRSISSQNRPIVMLIKGMQWADSCSCDLLDGITRESRVEGLVCIATIDSGLESNSCMKKFSADFLNNEKIATIKLRYLDQDQVRLFLTRTFDVSEVGTMWNECADILHYQTKGNFLYITMVLEMLITSNVIKHQEGQWIFSPESVRKQIQDSPLSSFFGTSSLLESPQSLEIMKVCACLGSEFDTTLIETVLGYPVQQYLQESVSKGYMAKTVNGFTFAHDCFQQAAYDLIPPEERSVFHVEIGRRLWRSMDSDDDLESNLYTILSQFSRGKQLLKRDKECQRLANLCLQAGQKAAKASAFRAAVRYLELGLFILMDKADKNLRWNQAYDLTLALYNAAAELNLVTSQYERSEQLVQEVLLYARSSLDKVQANGTRISIFGTLSKQHAAIDVGLKVLEELGESFPKRKFKLRILTELSAVRRMLRGKSDEQLMRLEPITNTIKHSCMQILYLIYLHCILVHPELGVLVALRSLRITLKYGLSPFSSSVFAIYGMVCLETNAIEEAHRFGQLGLKLLESYGMVEYLPRVYVAHYGIVDPWKNPIKDSLQPLLRAHQVGLHTGDREFAFLCSNCYLFHAFHSGVLLEDIVRKWRSIKGDMVLSRQESLLHMTLPFIQSILLLASSKEEALSFKGELMDLIHEHEQAYKSGLSLVATDIMVGCTTVAFLFDDYTQANKFATWAERHGVVVPSFDEMFRRFIRALVAFALVRQKTNRRKNLRIGRRILRQFVKVYSLKCPENCYDKQQLLQAELASVRGQSDLAYTHYTCAIAMAEKSEFIFEQALIHERFGFHLRNLGDYELGRTHLEQAICLYTHWGANGKAKCLKNVISSTASQS